MHTIHVRWSYRCLMRNAQLEFPPYVSEAAAAFVSGLLCRDGDKRLGTGPTGKADIRSHAFMEGDYIRPKLYPFFLFSKLYASPIMLFLLSFMYVS